MKFSDLNKDKKKPHPAKEPAPEPPKAKSPAKPAPPPEPPAPEPKIHSGKISPPESLFAKLAGSPSRSTSETGGEGRPEASGSSFSRQHIKTRAAPPSNPETEAATASKADEPAARAAYGRGIGLMKTILRDIEHSEITAYQELRRTTLELIQELQTHRQAMLVCARYSTAGNYLYAHSVNVAVLSLNLARTMNWEQQDLVLLGISALLHDIGMIKNFHLVHEPRPLTKEERLEIRRHPLDSEKLLDHIRDIDSGMRKNIGLIVRQEHERAGGRGYAGELRLEEIHHGAQIIGLCDVYEAMTHHRAWREPMLPHEVLKTLMRNASKEFNPKLVRSFLDCMSLFPCGSYVQLSGGEIARVVDIRPQFPTRPTVEVLLRSDGIRQTPPTILDLLSNPLVHITKPIDETKLNTGDRKLLMEFEAGRWWVE